MITGMVIGYSSTGSSASRLRARVNIAANNVPTAANPIVPVASSARERADAPRRRLEHQADGGTTIVSTAARSRENAQQLPDVERGAIHRRHQQRARRSRSGARARTPGRARACPRRRSRSTESPRPRPRPDALPSRTRTRTRARTTRRRRASCRGSRGSSARRPGPSSRRATPSPGTSLRRLLRREPRTVAFPQARARPKGRKPSVPQQQHAVRDRLDDFQIVGRQHDDASALAELPQAITQGARGRVVEARERLVEEDQPRLVQQRALERSRCRMPRRNPTT